ncbi:MAG: acyl-CoA dehydrogenase C-terminal domain-containing protein [Massilia sp.]|nr:acyl-CoA dehydrogenase C-terminal domain-containing protein [Massilia sp.]
MGQYVAPLRDMQFVLHEFLNVTEEFKNLPAYQEIDADIINQVLEEGAKFTQEVLFPLNHSGDREGCHYDAATKTVTTPKGFKEAYKQYVEGGWAALACDPEYGGQGLPVSLNNSFYEMLNSSNQAWTMYPGLSHGAYECLKEHGTDDQKKFYLPKLVSGEWTGTMCLTEAHCGTDLGLLRTKAEPQADGTYKITGSKIFISAGEHDMSENIVHLVLARLPDAPEGSKGISLFLVPKFLPNADGSVGERNGITCGAIEEKMGIHGNSTCQMNLDGAIGIQMRSLSGPKALDKPADPIIVHPDVRRMLLTAKAYAEGARALTSYVALQIDRELNHPDEEVRKEAAGEVALLTPVVKAFITDNGWIATSEAMQVYGGHGYISEWGMEQYVRDARINMIYEGTNTVQSLDLLGRKILMDNGAKLRAFGEKIKAFVEENGLDEQMSEFVSPLGELGEKVGKLTMEIGMKAFQNQDEVGAAAVPYLRVVGHMVFSYFFAQMAKIALAKKDSGDKFYESKLATARFYFARLYPETAMLIRQARSGASNLMALDADLF